MSTAKKKPLPPFVQNLKAQTEIIDAIVDMFESECEHPHCVAMRKFFEQFPGAPEVPQLGKRAEGR